MPSPNFFPHARPKLFSPSDRVASPPSLTTYDFPRATLFTLNSNAYRFHFPLQAPFLGCPEQLKEDLLFRIGLSTRWSFLSCLLLIVNEDKSKLPHPPLSKRQGDIFLRNNTLLPSRPNFDIHGVVRFNGHKQKGLLAFSSFSPLPCSSQGPRVNDPTSCLPSVELREFPLHLQ